MYVIIGLVKEIKKDENRVALTPAGVTTLVGHGHTVYVEAGAGEGSGFSDSEYENAGGTLLQTAKEVFAKADIITKVKEPIVAEYDLFRQGQILYTYLHLAPEPALTSMLIEKKIKAIAYETVQLQDGSLPLLTPMSEVAGRMATQIGAQFLEKLYGGRGILLGGVPGVAPGKVVVIGGGIVGLNAAYVAMGMGADVTIIDISAARLRQLDELYRGRLKTLMSNPHNIAEEVKEADLVVGAVLIPGARAPHLVIEDMVKSMRPGSVIVDVAIDQGGSIATCDHSTTHTNPTYVKYGVVHYAVANMPGAVPRTSTLALTNVTLNYLLTICDKGLVEALRQSEPLRKGVNVYDGHVTYEAVAKAHDLPYVPIADLLA